MRGDPDTARHLAYYAELRAAMSLLGSQGVGILDKTHFVALPGATLGQVRKATHPATWLVLSHWAARTAARDLLGRIFQPMGVPLRDWMDALPGLAGWQVVGSGWLRQWGIDLQHLSNDRFARNEASYRPTRLRGQRSQGSLDSMGYVSDFWGLFDPSPGSPFDGLDRHFLRESLERVFEANGLDRKTSEAAVRQLVRDLLPGHGNAELFIRFLLREVAEKTPSIFDHASSDSSIDQETHHLEVTSRAALLLRVATGSAAEFIGRDGTSREDIKYWWEDFGVDRGFWRESDEMDSLDDLYEDITEALDLSQAWRHGADKSRMNLLAGFPRSVSILTQCERIALWSMAP